MGNTCYVNACLQIDVDLSGWVVVVMLSGGEGSRGGGENE